MPGHHPLAEKATPLNSGSAVHCVHCGEPIVVRGWDKLNGFLLECPYCHGYHGKRWSIRAVAFMSLFLNGLSFFFTMRPLSALLSAAAWFTAFFFILPAVDNKGELLEVSAWIVAAFGPMAINVVLLVRHQMDLDRAPVSHHVTV